MSNRLRPRRRSIGVDYCNEARAFFAACTGVPIPPQRRYSCDQTIRRLIRAGIWQKLDCLYLFAAHDSVAAIINWKNPGTFNASLVSAPAFAADRGFTGNGTSSYIASNYTPSTNGIAWTQNTAHASAWSLTSIGAASNAQRLVGQNTSPTGRVVIIPRGSGDTFNCLINHSLSDVSVSNADSLGHFLINRSGASATESYRNGASAGTGTGTTDGNCTQPIVFGNDTTNFATMQIACGTLGGSLTAVDAAILYGTLLTYMRAVGAV